MLLGLSADTSNSMTGILGWKNLFLLCKWHQVRGHMGLKIEYAAPDYLGLRKATDCLFYCSLILTVSRLRPYKTTVDQHSNMSSNQEPHNLS